jgi:uncharacterized protein (TIGR03067 family)
MRRIVCLLAGVLLVVPSLGSDAPKEYDGATVQVDELEGTWRMTENDGMMVDPTSQRVTTFRSRTYTINWNDGDTDRGSYRIDSTHNPPRLSWVPSSGPWSGHTTTAIYQIDGDTLRLAFYGFGDDPPEGFEVTGRYFVQTYKRVK